MNSKPLTYDSLETVLYHLDPNIRLVGYLDKNFPSVRVAERSVPLKIERLHCNGQFEINKTCYSLDVCSEGRDVLFTSSSNSDVKEYGEMDETSGRAVMPGDVVLRPLNWGTIPPAMNEEEMNAEIKYHEIEIEINRLRLALLDSVAQSVLQSFMEVPTYYNQDPFITFLHGNEAQMRELGSSPEVENAWRLAVSVTEHAIRVNEQSLQILLNRRNNVRPNFEIKLEINSPSGVRTERVKYTAKLHSAEKSLLKMMFGHRKHVVQVKKLVTNHCMAIRFPLGLRMRIRELDSFGNIGHIHSALNAIVDSSSYPLERLEIGYDSEDGQDTDHEVVKSAKSLVLFSAFFDTPMLPVFLNLPNKKVHVRDYCTMTNEEHVLLIKRCLEKGKSIGTCFTFAMQNEHEGEKILEMAEQQFDGAVVGDKYVVIPMNVSSQLKLSNELVLKEGHESWMFKMEVLPRESTLL